MRLGALLSLVVVLAAPSADASMLAVPRAHGADARTTFVSTAPAPSEIALGDGHSCVLLVDGTVRCWGGNGDGRLGDGTTTQRRSPVQVLASGSTQGADVLTGVTQISAGGLHTCGRLADATVRCWGENSLGRLGDGTTTNRPNPVEVEVSAGVGLTDVAQVAAGGAHTCALLTSGAVRCWGRNDRGQLGDGTTTDRSNPVAVVSLVDTGEGTISVPLIGVAQISAGGLHTCARLADGTVRCWGENEKGQLADGSTIDRPNPVTSFGGGVTAVMAGDQHTCVLMTDGTLDCAGWNVAGQLGDGTTTDRASAVQVLASGSTQGTDALVDVEFLPSRATQHTCVVLTDGTLRCWGANGDYQLGDGTLDEVDRSNPVQVLASGSTQGVDVLSGVSRVATGGFHSCAIRTAGTVLCWGQGAGGQLGDGTTTSRGNPVLAYMGAVPSTSDTTPVPPAVACGPATIAVGATVSCAITGGDPGIEILWRAAYNPVFAEAGVTLDASGSGGFSFVVPREALGRELTVELVEWLAPVPLGVVGGPVPSSVPSGEGLVPVPVLFRLMLWIGLLGVGLVRVRATSRV